MLKGFEEVPFLIPINNSIVPCPTANSETDGQQLVFRNFMLSLLKACNPGLELRIKKTIILQKFCRTRAYTLFGQHLVTLLLLSHKFSLNESDFKHRACHFRKAGQNGIIGTLLRKVYAKTDAPCDAGAAPMTLF